MTDSANDIRKALRDESSYYGTDAAGHEWRFVVDDEYGEVWGYLEVRQFSADLKEAATAIAELLRAPAGGATP